jgi:hypothetical protein
MKKNKILSVFLRIFLSGEMQAILFIAGVVFIYFLSPEGQPANRGEDGKGTWNLWTGLFLCLLSGGLMFFKDKLPNVDFDNDPDLNKLDDELYDINRSYIPKLQKIKDTQPENWKQLVKYGLVDPKDFKDKDSDNESTSDPQKQEKK